MAAAERHLVERAGLDAHLVAYRQAQEQVGPVLAAARDLLERLLAVGADLDEAALARVAAAESARAEAEARALAAEDQAAAHARARADAERQARADRDAMTVAQRLARDAERDRDEQVRAAWAKVVDAERAQGVAEGQAAEASANLRAFVTRFDDLADETTALRATHARADRELTQARAELAAATGQVEELRAAVERHQQELQAARVEHQERVDGLAGQLADARARLAVATDQVAELRDEARGLISADGALRHELADLRHRLAAAEDAPACDGGGERRG
uniref:hypothetical protein n=1 Tax=Actinokineospora sp. CA-119265 TaxID=3239890 RepID=UPI003F490D98